MNHGDCIWVVLKSNILDMQITFSIHLTCLKSGSYLGPASRLMDQYVDRQIDPQNSYRLKWNDNRSTNRTGWIVNPQIVFESWKLTHDMSIFSMTNDWPMIRIDINYEIRPGHPTRDLISGDSIQNQSTIKIKLKKRKKNKTFFLSI